MNRLNQTFNIIKNISQLSQLLLVLCIFLIYTSIRVNAQALYYFKDSTNKYGYIDETGNIVIRPQFDDCGYFLNNSLTQVKFNGKYGFINRTGQFVIQPQFDKASGFANNGLAPVKLNGKWGYVDTTGNFVIQPQFDAADSFSENGLAKVQQNGKWGYVDTTGNFVINPIFDDAWTFFDDELTNVSLNGSWGYINQTGQFVIQPRYGFASDFADNGLALVNVKCESGYKYGFIDKTGKYVIQPQFDDADNFSFGLASVQQNGKWGYIDKNGKIAIKPQYEEARRFAYNGLAAVKVNSKWGYINKTGKIVIQPQYEYSGFFMKHADGVAEVKLNGKTGYIDENGNFYTTRAKAIAANEERNACVKSGENYTAYIKRVLPVWNEYLQMKGVVKPKTLSAENVKQIIEQKINIWQQKGEFETTTMWQSRVNNETRSIKIGEIAQHVERDYNNKVATYNSQASQLRASYELKHKRYTDRYCAYKAKEFATQNFDLKPYDADNGTFLISSTTGGDILLPVPLDKAQQFKADWGNIKSKVRAVFVPTGDDVALQSVTFGDYTYDGNTKANYAVTNIDYNFAPIEISNLDLASADYNFDQISSAPAVTVSNPDAKTISATKVTPNSKTITAGSASDVDINIPQSKVTAKNTFAIVIANENYQNVERVEDAANDGKIIAKYFTSALGIPQDQVMTYTDASYGNMIDALDRIKNISQAYRGSDYNVIFYYAGHGVPDEQSHEAYLLPTDGKPGSSAVNISLSKLYSTLGNLGASTVYVMLDACFSGSQRGDGMLAQARGVAIKAKAAEPQGNMVVLSASQGDETAYPYKNQNHGMFTYYLLKKLQESSGNVTIGELADYVIDNVKKTSVIKNNGKIQTPTVRASLSSGESWRSQKLVK